MTISIDAGRDGLTYLAPVAIPQPIATVSNGADSTRIPCEPVGGGVLVFFPAAQTVDWPAGPAVLTITGNSKDHIVNVAITRIAANQKQLREAADAAIAANKQAKTANDAGIAQIDAWLKGPMPTTVAGVVGVLKVLAQQNKAAAQHRNGMLEELNVLIRLALDAYDDLTT